MKKQKPKETPESLSIQDEPPTALLLEINSLPVSGGLPHGDRPQANGSPTREFEQFFKLSLDLLCIAGLDGYFKRLNPAWYKTLGYSEQELLSTPYLEFVHPEDQAATVAELEKLGEGRDTIDFENRLRCRDGSYRWLAWNAKSFAKEQVLYCIGRDITERKQANLLLQRQQEQLHLALEGSGDGLWDWNLTTGEAYFSPQWLEMLGYGTGELSGHVDTWKRLIHPDDQSWVMGILQAHLQDSCVSYTFDYRVLMKSGEWKWIANFGRVVTRNSDGAPLRMAGTHRDINERKRAEAKLKETKIALQALAANLSSILDNAAAAISSFCQTPDGRYNYLFNSKGSEAIYGYTSAEMQQDHLWESRVHPADLEPLLSRIDAAILREEICIVEYRFYHKDGSLRWIESTYTSRYDPVANCWIVVVFDIDISDRKQAEAALKASEERYYSLVNNIPGAVYRCAFNPNWTMEYVSLSITELTGYAPTDLMNDRVCSFASLVHPDDWAPAHQQLTAAIAAQVTVTLEYRLRHRDGNYRWVKDCSQGIFNQAGDCLYTDGILLDISDRKRLQVALQASEQKYRAIVEDQTELICRYKPDSTILFVNEAYCRYFQVNRADLIGQSYQPLIYEADLERVHQLVNSLSPENPIIAVENRVVVNGELRWTQWINRMILDDQGECLEFQSIGRDITDRKRVEAALCESEERLRLALEAAQMGLWDWNILTNRIIWSPTLERIMEMELGSFDGSPETLISLIHPDDRSLVQAAIDRAVHQRESYNIEFRFVLPDGRIRWAAAKGQVFYDCNNQPIRMTGLDLDISDRKQREEIIRNIALGVSAEVGDAFFQSLTVYLCKALEVEYAFVGELLPPGMERVKIIAGCAKGQPIEPFEYPLVNTPCQHVVGQQIRVYPQVQNSFPEDDYLREIGAESYLGAPLFSSTGDAFGLIAIVSSRPLTDTGLLVETLKIFSARASAELERKRSAEIHQNLEQEKALNELKLRFFSIASHEFRTPLSTILIAAQLLENTEPRGLSAKSLRNVQRIQKCAQRLRQLITDTLTIARIEAQKLELNPQPLALRVFCTQLVEEIQSSMASEHSIVFRYKGKNDPVSLDEKLLSLILSNLLTNALKYSAPTTAIDFQVSLLATEVVFMVKDRGIGIRPEDQPYLFEPFYRGTNIGKIDGSGLGLAIVNKCVDLHRGQITFESQVDQGTKFVVRLPHNFKEKREII
ncbi:MAG: PAS domain-containing protein [Aphanocapsa sp. GSE-SYN-MK-11-07L]|jgi:PAS domain S-box-containing protein|nr:PAS domain-containing protein [Aphanocapsa sp. GSE-SYN-MK-11-07L]